MAHRPADSPRDEKADIIASARMHLELERSLGADQVPYRPERVKELRAARRARSTAPAASKASAPSRPAALPARPVAPVPSSAPAPSRPAAPAASNAPAQPRPVAPAAKPASPAAAAKAAALEKLRRELSSCCRCGLGKSRKNLVFGVGRPDADLMFIGEGPGEQEDEQGIPFVGKAGQLLTKIIEAIGLTRDEVYIANIVKCRPPGNRQPLPDESALCLPFLRQQIEIIRPRIIVTLGNVPTQTLLATDVGITRTRGIFVERDGALFMPTFHPAYLLRDPNKKKEVWEDMKTVWAKMKELGLKIGELKSAR